MELIIDVLGARGFHTVPAGWGVSVQCRVNGQLLETLPSTNRNGGGEPIWRAGGRLAWRLTQQDLQRIKAKSPTIKLVVLSRPTTTVAGSPPLPQSLGFVLLDIRSAEQSISQASHRHDSWIAVHGSSESGGELRVSMRLLAVRYRNNETEAPLSPLEGEAAASPSRRRDGAMERDADMGGVRDVSWLDTQESASAAAAAPEALRTALRAHGSADPGPLSSARPRASGELDVDSDAVWIGSEGAAGSLAQGRAYSLSVSIEGLQRLGALLSFQQQQLLPGAAPPQQQLWLSYKLFGVVVQTDSFPSPVLVAATSGGHEADAAGTPPFPPIRDTFALRSCLPDLASFLDAAPPLQVRA